MKNAFTLSEVLVTLAIIGVVAAMTVPNLMENYQRQSFVTQLRKIHSELSQAAESALAEGNTQRLMETPAVRKGASNFLNSYFKTTRTCSASTAMGDCFSDVYTTLTGSDYFYSPSDSACAVLASGSSICIQKMSSGITATVDVNGKQQPNTYGRDLFHLYIENDGTVTSVGNPDNATVEACQQGDYGECFAQILHDGWVMDY